MEIQRHTNIHISLLLILPKCMVQCLISAAHALQYSQHHKQMERDGEISADEHREKLNETEQKETESG